MNVLKRLLLFASILLGSLWAMAQGGRVTGTILSQGDNAALQGVTITNRTTGQSTGTDASGSFSIAAVKGNVLVFSFIGYEQQQVTVGDNSTLNIRLTRTDNTLETVVVAMDVKRNPRELGYSVQKVSGAELAETQRENFLNGMQGRIAGATITSTSGMAGASSQIVLRGFNSMALSNSPLFVVDGVIVDNQTVNETSNGGGLLGLASDRANRGNDYTNRIADINPNDIESITVLKGPEATALYGSQASSGAIVITTKKANTNGKIGIAYDNSFRVQKLTRFPRVSNKFNSGANGAFEESFSFFGPAYGRDVPVYDNVGSFFQTGFAQTHNLSTEFGKKNYSFRLSGSLFDQQSPVPNNIFRRYNARISNTTKIGKYIDISPSLSYIRSVNDKPLRGASGYLLNLMVWPVDNDIRNWRSETGSKNVLFAANPNAELDNPFYNVYRNFSSDQTDRYIATMGVNINPFNWLSLAGRFGYDAYKTEGHTLYDPMSFFVTRAAGGAQDNYYRNYQGYNHTLTATARKTIGNFTGRIMVGNMWQDYETSMYSVFGTNLVDSVGNGNLLWKNGQVIDHNNFGGIVSNGRDSNATRPNTRIRLINAFRNGLPNYSRNRQAAYFGEASIGYKNAIFLSYSHRFEESSIFPADLRNYNYPAASLSIIASDLIPAIKNNVLNYLKFRGSLATTARSSSPYANQSIFGLNNASGGGFAYGFNNNNFFLRPEIQKTFELGTETRLFNNRITLDATYYNTLNTDQIVENFRASYGTGFVLNTLNVGSTRNQGVEIALDVTPVQTTNFRWNTRFNFNRMWNEVLELPSNVPEFYISDTWLAGNARGGLIVGGSTTSITSFGYQRNNKGEILIEPTTGLPLVDGIFTLRGDRNPDFTLGIVNNLSYKNWRLNFLWDLKVGGDIYNGTERYLTIQGKSLRTDDRKTPRVVKGVLRDGLENTDNPTANNISIIPYNNQLFYTARMPDEEFIERDINWFRLRDLTLNYTFPVKTIRNLRFVKSLSAFVTANDLVLFTNYSGADPAVNGNTAGTRGVGAFGFDFGNIGAPISVNAGFRANF